MAKKDKGGDYMVPPYSIDLEQQILAAILVDNSQYQAVSGEIEPDAFFDDLHRRLYERMGEMLADGFRASPATLKYYFEDEKVGDMNIGAYFARLIANAPPPDFTSKNVSLLKDIWLRRQLFMACSASLDDTANEGLRTVEIMDQHMAEVQAARSKLAVSRLKTVSAGEAADRVIQVAEARKEGGSEVTGITTGLTKLDAMIGGLQRGYLHIVGGRPSMGKSTLATCMCMAAAERDAVACLNVSAEMTAAQLTERMLTDLAYDLDAPIFYDRINKGNLTSEEMQRLKFAREALHTMPIFIDDRGAPSLADIRTATYTKRVELDKAGIDLGLLIVDHLQLAKPSHRYEGNRSNELGELTAGLKALAKDLNMAVVALSQLSRQLEARENKRPMLSDLRASGDIEQDADVVLFVYRDAYYLAHTSYKDRSKESDRIIELEAKRHELELIVAKQRQGPTGTVRVFCDIGASAIRDREYGYQKSADAAVGF